MMMMRVRKRRRSCGVVVNFFSKKKINKHKTKQHKNKYAQYISSLYFVHAVTAAARAATRRRRRTNISNNNV